MGRHSLDPIASADTAVIRVGPIVEGVFAGDDVPEDASAHRHHRALWTATVVFWLLGLAAGFVATLTVAARFGCVAGAKGLACTNPGSGLGLLLIIAVILTVGITTVYAFEARDNPRIWGRYFGVGLALLAVVVVASRLLSSTL